MINHKNDTRTIKAVILSNSIEEASTLKKIIKELPLNIDISIAKDIDNFILLTSSGKVDFLILDWNYQQCSTIDLIEKMRSGEKYKNVSILMIANEDEKFIQTKYPQLQIDLIFHRPFSVQEIQQALTKLFDNIDHSRIIPENFNVLILDNNPVILEIMSDHMMGINHDKYQTCLSVNEAINLIKTNHYDLLLLDWNLDDGTCLDIIKFLNTKKSDDNKRMPLVVVITGRNDVEDLMTLLQYDIKDHIIKPFDHAEFKEKISYALERYNNSRSTR